MEPGILHQHTYFLFPFSVDRPAVIEDHPEAWSGRPRWIDGLDAWIAAHQRRESSPVVRHLGSWRRSPYTRFDLESRAYQDMVFFHPFVRRVFFDTGDATAAGVEKEALLRCYSLPIGHGARLWLEAQDVKGRSATVEVTDLRLFLFANGIGILSIGIEATGLPASQALWINESMRKVYASSARQVREGRVPCRLALTVESEGSRHLIAEETFQKGEMIGFQPPLAQTITALLYFADYGEQEYEPVLDERMIVYSYSALDAATLPAGFLDSEEYQVLLSRFLYVDRQGEGFRYEPGFVREHMRRQMYSRWAHQGTWYGATSYSNITVAVGNFDCDEHLLREGFLIHRMFVTRYYLMSLVALFYRATVLDFAERTALVSKRLYLDQEDGKLSLENIRLASDLRAEFLHFANYWCFDELANKDEEQEHFVLQCGQYRIDPMKREIEQEVEALNASLYSYFQFRNTEAVNRLAMLSLILGAGAVLTGFFGMNFGRGFAKVFFEPGPGATAAHYLAIAAVALLVIGSIGLGFYLVFANWADYRDILTPRGSRNQGDTRSLKRG